jgi:hypothetical protein
MNEIYRRLKLKGFDMSWYERGKASLVTPLEDDACSKASIYLMKANGTVWTLRLNERVHDREDGTAVVTYEGQPHRQVRDTGKTLPQATYVCMHTKTGYSDLTVAMSHDQCKLETTT